MTEPRRDNLISKAERKLRGASIRMVGGLLNALMTSELVPSQGGDRVLNQFRRRCLTMQKPRVLELGTSRSIPDRSTMHKDWVPHAGEYLGTDIQAGVDVDIVADIHRLTQVTGCEQFDVIISCSSFEHFKYPHLAAHEIMRALRVGGILYIQTHQSFPLHAYPYDYFRFSKEALAGLFGTRMGFRTIATGYEFPARIYSGKNHQGIPIGTDVHPAFLNVCLFGEKLGSTLEQYVYEYDALSSVGA